jgi:hypothetical protein
VNAERALSGAAPLGPLLAGFLLADFSERLAMGVFAAISLALAVWCTLSRAIRGAPKLADLAAANA